MFQPIPIRFALLLKVINLSYDHYRFYSNLADYHRNMDYDVYRRQVLSIPTETPT